MKGVTLLVNGKYVPFPVFNIMIPLPTHPPPPQLHVHRQPVPPEPSWWVGHSVLPQVYDWFKDEVYWVVHGAKVWAVPSLIAPNNAWIELHWPDACSALIWVDCRREITYIITQWYGGILAHPVQGKGTWWYDLFSLKYLGRLKPLPLHCCICLTWRLHLCRSYSLLLF